MPILAVTSFPLHAYSQRAAQSGAQGIVSKRSLSNILAAIKTLLHGRTWDSGQDAIFSAPRQRPEATATGYVELSAREQTVIALFSRGYTSEQAALELGVTVNTIKTYSTRLCSKLGARTRSQAVATWMTLRGQHE